MTEKNRIFGVIQNFLVNPPTIIWGSGATVPFGMPSMDNLRKVLQGKGHNINENEDLEKYLDRIEKENKNDDVISARKIIWESISEKDITIRKSFRDKTNSDYAPIINLFNRFANAHPKKLHIITTNYDRFLEYLFSANDITYTDGFTGKVFSNFEELRFSETNTVCIYKMHGSLSWFCKNNPQSIFFEDKGSLDDLSPIIISPGDNKYKYFFQEPYRTLSTIADKVIKESSCFFVIGFGFNDEHITPLMEAAINNGRPIVIVAKEASPACLSKVESAKNCILIEANRENEEHTKVTIKKDNQEKTTLDLDEPYWQVTKFGEILC